MNLKKTFCLSLIAIVGCFTVFSFLNSYSAQASIIDNSAPEEKIVSVYLLLNKSQELQQYM